MKRGKPVNKHGAKRLKLIPALHYFLKPVSVKPVIENGIRVVGGGGGGVEEKQEKEEVEERKYKLLYFEH